MQLTFTVHTVLIHGPANASVLPHTLLSGPATQASTNSVCCTVRWTKYLPYKHYGCVVYSLSNPQDGQSSGCNFF